MERLFDELEILEMLNDADHLDDARANLERAKESSVKTVNLDALVIRAPFKAHMMPFGAPIWFVADKDGKHICQAILSTDETMANNIAELLNIGIKHV